MFAALPPSSSVSFFFVPATACAMRLLVLAPSAYMLEVYDRVVNSRSHMTLAMLTLLVLAVFVVMEVLDWARGQLMHEASLALDKQVSGRVFSSACTPSEREFSR